MPAMDRHLHRSPPASLLLALLLWGVATAQAQTAAPSQAAAVVVESPAAPSTPLNLTLPRAASRPDGGSPDKALVGPVRPYGSGYESRGLGASAPPASTASAASSALANRQDPAPSARSATRAPSSLQRYGAGGGGHGRGRR